MAAEHSNRGDAKRTRTVRGEIKFFTIAEVGERLSVSQRSVFRWIRSGDLKVHRFGALVRISEGDLRQFLTLHQET
jgi:excisionase family DNA binding protein